MKKFLSLALVFSMLLALAMPAMAAGGVSLVSDADSRYIEVSNGYSGIVTYRDNKKTYSMEVTGNGRYFIGLQRDFTGQLKLVGSYGDPSEPLSVRAPSRRRHSKVMPRTLRSAPSRRPTRGPTQTL